MQPIRVQPNPGYKRIAIRRPLVGRGPIRLLWASVICLCPLALRADQWNKHWDVGAHPELRIHAGDAAVVVQGTGGSGIDASLTTRGWQIGRNGVEVTEHHSGNSVDIEVKVPQHHFNFGERSIRLEVRVPRELMADIHTGDGSIRLSGLNGSIRAETGDGSVRAEDVNGRLYARTGDGSVHVAGRFDDLQLHTNDGSVEASVGRGSKLQTGWRIETGDGSVRIGLPSDLAADLELRTGDGRIRLEGAAASDGEERDRHEVRKRLHGGGPPLIVRTGDGSITIDVD